MIYKAPIPFGPYSLWEEIDSKSTPNSWTSMGTFPTACTASVWNTTPCSWQSFVISPIGWIVPTSLFPNIIETILVFSEMLFLSSERLIIPKLSTGRNTTSKPSWDSFLHGSKIASCSIEEVIILPEECLVAIPRNAVLFDSVPPEVRKISEGSAFIKDAICFLAFSIAFLDNLP